MICLTNHFFILILCIHIEKRLQNVQLSKIKSKIISQHSNIQLCNTINLRCKSSSIISSIGLAIHHSYIVTTRKRSLGQGNIFRSVCQEFCSQGGFCLSTCWDTPPGTRHPPGPGTPQKQTPLAQSMLGDTVNKQVVCILLECNLVCNGSQLLQQML